MRGAGRLSDWPWTWIKREEHAVGLEEGIERLPAYTGLYDNVHILFMKRNDLIHMLAEWDADTAVRSTKVAFKTRQARHGNNWDTVNRTWLNNQSNHYSSTVHCPKLTLIH